MEKSTFPTSHGTHDASQLSRWGMEVQLRGVKLQMRREERRGEKGEGRGRRERGGERIERRDTLLSAGLSNSTTSSLISMMALSFNNFS